MSKTLVLPEGILKSLSLLGLSLGTKHLTFGELRYIATIIHNVNNDHALNYLMTKTLWAIDKAKGYIVAMQTELEPFFLLQRIAAAQALKTTEIKANIIHYSQKMAMLKDMFINNSEKNLFPIVTGRQNGFETVSFVSNEDLSFDSRYEDYIETSQLLHKERQRAVTEL